MPTTFRGILTVALMLFSSSVVLAQPASTELRARLAAFEQRTSPAAGDEAELAAIADQVLREAASHGATSDVVVLACSSDFAAANTACHDRLWRIARERSTAVHVRAEAAAALVRRGDKEASAALVELARGASARQLAAMAPSLLALPSELSLPIFSRMLSADEPAATTQACRALGEIDAFESRHAVQGFLAATPRGTGEWYACLLAAAELGDVSALQEVRFRTPYMRGVDLIAAGQVLLRVDQELGLSLLMQATRQGTDLLPLEAADRLAAARPDLARDIAEKALRSPDARARAGGLMVYRRLMLDPTPEVRSMLADADPSVRVRAAEVVLELRRKRASR
ncbi:MAG TPA: hypothetical protein VM364_14155 [Vicinamibacterales bacterium]|nr:hypothetical protein [Vicinamibacterales bacterium]